MKTWVLARFDKENDFVAAAEKMRGMGFDELDGHMPYPSHGALAAVKPKKSIIPYLVFFGGLTGFCFAFGLQYFCNVLDYPIVIGGRTTFSPTVYIPICFECTILFSVLTAVGSTFFLGGLPMPYHPFFVSEGFQKASTDSFILGVRTPEVEKVDTVSNELKQLGAFSVERVEE